MNAPDDAFCASTDLCTVDTCDVVDGCVKTVEPGCCGNGTVDTGEVCDDGNIVSGDGCDSTCTCECASIAPKVCIQPVAIIPDASGLGVAPSDGSLPFFW